jgi:ABC-type Na+ efflux pump permease subunit
MGFSISDLGPSLINPGAPTSGTRFTGTPAKGRMILAIFGAVLAFGLTALGYGLWQMFTGRRSKRVIYFMVALALILMLLACVL